LFSSFDKESTEQQTSLALHTAASSLGAAADTVVPRPGRDIMALVIVVSIGAVI